MTKFYDPLRDGKKTKPKGNEETAVGLAQRVLGGTIEAHCRDHTTGKTVRVIADLNNRIVTPLLKGNR